MQSFNAKQFVKYLQQYCENNIDTEYQYEEVIDHCRNLLGQQLELNMIQLLMQYTFNQINTLSFANKMIFQQFAHDFQSGMAQNIEMRNQIYEITSLTFYDMLYLIITSLDDHTINYPVSKKYIKVTIYNYSVFCKIDIQTESTELSDKVSQLPALIQSLFLSQYFIHEQTRYLLTQAAAANVFQQQLEQCILLMPQLRISSTKCVQFIGQLQDTVPKLVDHILRQILKITQRQHFIQLLKFFLQLEPHIFTQVIQDKINSASPFIQRNCLIILQHLFPTTQAQIEVRAEVNSIVNCIMSDYIIVRQQAIITAGIIIYKYSDQLEAGQTQLLFDQVIVQCFDKCKKVRIAALNQLQSFFGVQSLKYNVINSILQNAKLFQNLFGVKDKQTKNILIQIFLLIQQHIQDNQNRQLTQRYDAFFTTEFKEYLLKSLATLGKQSITLLFPDKIGTFINNPDFCYEQIYISAKSCQQFLNIALNELIQSEFTLQIVHLSDLYFFNLEQNNLFTSNSINEAIIEYIKNAQINKKIIGFASLIHVLLQILLNQIDINDYFYVIILQISQIIYFIHIIARQDNLLHQQVIDFNKFAFKSLNKQNIKKLQTCVQEDSILSPIFDEIIYIHQLLQAGSKQHNTPSIKKWVITDSVINKHYHFLKKIYYRFDSSSLKLLFGSDLYCKLEILISQRQDIELIEEITDLKQCLYNYIQEITVDSEMNVFRLQCDICMMILLNKPLEDIKNYIEKNINQINVENIPFSEIQPFLFIVGDIYQLINSPYINQFFEKIYNTINGNTSETNVFNIIEMIKIGYQTLIDPLLSQQKQNQGMIDILKDNLEVNE